MEVTRQKNWGFGGISKMMGECVIEDSRLLRTTWPEPNVAGLGSNLALAPWAAPAKQ